VDRAFGLVIRDAQPSFSTHPSPADSVAVDRRCGFGIRSAHSLPGVFHPSPPSHDPRTIAPRMAEPPIQSRGPFPRRAGLVLIVAWGLGLRAVAAAVVEAYARRKGTLCVFDDTVIYWKLAEAIREGGPYRVMQWDVPHFALRTPGYPLFLAACQTLFG